MDVANHLNDILGSVAVILLAFLSMIFPPIVIDSIIVVLGIGVIGLILWFWLGILFGKTK